MPDHKTSSDDPAQSQRFIDMAHEVGADEADPAFEAKMKAIARHKQKNAASQDVEK